MAILFEISSDFLELNVHCGFVSRFLGVLDNDVATLTCSTMVEEIIF
jgi:hypothetical protein